LTGTERPDFIFSVTSRRSAAIRATSLPPAAWTTAWLSLTPVPFTRDPDHAGADRRPDDPRPVP